MPDIVEATRARKPNGKHPEKELTAVEVRNLTASGMYADGNCLYLVVDESGAKRWILRTTIHGKRHDVGLGSLSLISLAAAREEAARLRKIARAGGDPLSERRRERAVVPTFEEAARQVHKEHSGGFRNSKHAAQWLSSLEAYAFPAIGGRRVDHLESADILKALTPIWLKIPETARRVKQRIKVVMDWSKAKGYCVGSNPTDGLTKVLPKHNMRQEHFAALPYAQVAAFIERLQTYEGVSTRLAFEFLILNASRTSEVLLAQWSEIDLDAKTWTIPAGRMKAKVEHKVPLNPRALEILASAKTITDGGPYVFPGAVTKHPLSNMCFHMALRRLKRQNITPHGFRSSFRDWAAEKTNFPREVCEAALAHTLSNKTEAAYNRTDLFDRRRKLMEAWAAFAVSPGGKVVKMRA